MSTNKMDMVDIITGVSESQGNDRLMNTIRVMHQDQPIELLEGY